MASTRPVDLCRACGGNYPCKSYKHNLFIAKTSERYDYAMALETITGRIAEGDDLPKAVCGKCKTLLTRYYKSSNEVARVGNLFRERACTVASLFRPTTPVQLDRDFASIDIILESQSDDVSSSEFTNQKTTMVLVQSQTSRKTRIVTGPMEKVVENIVRGRFHSLPKAVMDVPSLAPLVIKEVLKRVDKECHAITSFEFNSILRQTSPSALRDFAWDKVLEEWRTNAPTFTSFLETASTSVKTQNKKTPNAHRKKCTMAMAGSSLLQARCERMSAAMHRNSIILHHGNARKGCHRRLAKLGICVSRQSTSNKLKGMSDSRDCNFEWMPVTDRSWTTTANEEPRDNSSTSSTCTESHVKQRLEMPVLDDDSGSDREDELPQVVVLKKGDLSTEEVTQIKVAKGGTEKEDKPPADGKILFKKPTKRSSEKFQGITASSSKKKKTSSVMSDGGDEEKDEKDGEKDGEKDEGKVKLGKVKNKSLLSFGDDEDDD